MPPPAHALKAIGFALPKGEWHSSADIRRGSLSDQSGPYDFETSLKCLADIAERLDLRLESS